MKRARFPEDQASLCEWLEQNRKRDEEPSKVWKEWWTLSKAIQRSGVEQFLPQPFVAEHVDERGNGVDFSVKFPNGSVLALEVTEATTKEDGEEIALTRESSEALGFGSHRGRFKGGIKGDADALAMAGDIKDAILRKSNHRYGTRSALLIYPNSNAIFAEMEIVVQHIPLLTPESPFDFALVVGGHSLIAITKEMVTLTPETESSTR
jgi:hypothetical protein